MQSFRHSFFLSLAAAALGASAAAQAPSAAAPKAPATTSAPFQGLKANKGTVALQRQDDTWTLTLSDDFVVPDTPAPHWQVVDARGNVFLLQRLVAKDNRFHKTIAIPDYVLDLAKVQIWCSFAETLLGEAGFGKVVPLLRVALDAQGNPTGSAVLLDAGQWRGVRPGYPDGMKVDAAGNLFACGPGGLYVFHPDGTLLGMLATGAATSNCAFGDDPRTLFLTADHAVLAVRW